MENCTVYLDNNKIRGELYRVVNPDDLRFVSVNFPESALEHFDFDRVDANKQFRIIIPTVLIEPDEDAPTLNFYYYIGDSVDACPFSLKNFEWYKGDNDE